MTDSRTSLKPNSPPKLRANRGEPLVSILIRIPQRLIDKLDREAEKEGKTRNKHITDKLEGD